MTCGRERGGRPQHDATLLAAIGARVTHSCHRRVLRFEFCSSTYKRPRDPAHGPCETRGLRVRPGASLPPTPPPPPPSPAGPRRKGRRQRTPDRVSPGRAQRKGRGPQRHPRRPVLGQRGSACPLPGPPWRRGVVFRTGRGHAGTPAAGAWGPLPHPDPRLRVRALEELEGDEAGDAQELHTLQGARGGAGAQQVSHGGLGPAPPSPRGSPSFPALGARAGRHGRDGPMSLTASGNVPGKVVSPPFPRLDTELPTVPGRGRGDPRVPVRAARGRAGTHHALPLVVAGPGTEGCGQRG